MVLCVYLPSLRSCTAILRSCDSSSNQIQDDFKRTMKSPLSYQHLYGLIGYPLVHSFSRDFFNQKFIAEGTDALYMNFEIEDLGLLMEIIAEYPNLNGLNVTAPFKEAIIPYLDSLDADAQEIGAVNVVRFIRDKKTGELELRGYNSDEVGFEKTIDGILTPERTSAMVLGTGGAAKAVRAALQRHGIEVQLVSRRKSEHTLVYEEKMGISGWVSGNRVLIGNRLLMKNHGVMLSSQ